MPGIRTMTLTAAAIGAAGALWHAEGRAQTPAAPGTGIVTVFDRAKLDATFADALAKGGTAPLWSHTANGVTTDVSVHSRESTMSACPQQGCSHKNYTAVVIVTSGSATLEVGGSAKAAGADASGGALIQGGERRRIAAGDMFIMPPDTMHWYRDVTPPFRYLEVPVP